MLEVLAVVRFYRPKASKGKTSPKRQESQTAKTTGSDLVNHIKLTDDHRKKLFGRLAGHEKCFSAVMKTSVVSFERCLGGQSKRLPAWTTQSQRWRMRQDFARDVPNPTGPNPSPNSSERTAKTPPIKGNSALESGPRYAWDMLSRLIPFSPKNITFS